MVVFMVYSPATMWNSDNTPLQECTTDQARNNKRDLSVNMSHTVDSTFQQLITDSPEAGLRGRVYVSIGDITFWTSGIKNKT